jgi:tRNA nucleotidyltransferase (CCA-adding enzyme)
LEIITTHVGADFDAVASMVAARRLHPDARLFFPGSQQESVRRLLAESDFALDVVGRRQVSPADIGRLILCDCRQPDRLGVVGDWLAQRPELPVVTYDHHHANAADVVGGPGSLVDPTVGAATTLLVEELARREMTPSPAEATLFLVGIYEDTGALTHATTSPRDLRAAAGLLVAGADLAVVRRHALGRLDPLRVDILHRMCHTLEICHLHGHRVGLVGLDLDEFVDELAPLVSRCLEMFELPLLVACFAEPDRVAVIARGQLPGYDLGRLLAAVAGGGGHATAAAGSVRRATLLEVRERVVEELLRTLPPAARARDLMLSRYSVLAAETPVSRARHLLNRWRVNAAPVATDGRAIGAVTRQMLDAALQHGLRRRPVSTVMDTDLVWVAPDLPAEELAGSFLGRQPRFVLVGDRRTGHAVGLVTRMAAFRHLHSRVLGADDGSERRLAGLGVDHHEVGKLLNERLAPALRERLALVTAVAGRHHVVVHAVGGFVRDLLLGRENRDLDLVVEGDGPHFAQLLAAELPGARVRVHEAFMTAVVTGQDGDHLLDVASARSEFYRAPAALPEVQTSALRQDLYRRDFTINTLAIRLGPEPVPELVDFFGARRDLADRRLRVLHSLSFLDDPTRVLRAVRFELQLGFSLTPESRRLVKIALGEGVFAKLSGHRLRAELVELLDRPELALPALDRLAELDLLGVLHPDLALEAGVRQRLHAALVAHDWWRLEQPGGPPARLWVLLLLVLAEGLRPPAVALLADRLSLAGEERALLLDRDEARRRAQATLETPRLAPHLARQALDGLSGEELLWLMAGGEPWRSWVHRDLLSLRHLRLSIGGAELLELGARPGPAIGEALRSTLAARLDSEISVADELSHAAARLGLRPCTAASSGGQS